MLFGCVVVYGVLAFAVLGCVLCGVACLLWWCVYRCFLFGVWLWCCCVLLCDASLFGLLCCVLISLLFGVGVV